MRKLIDYLFDQDVEYKTDVQLKPYSSINIGGVADLITFPGDIDKLINLIDFLEDNGYRYRVVGRMTNILPPDFRYNGVIINTAKINSFYIENNSVICECGVVFSKLILKLAKLDIGGFENLFSIPGSIGGMIYSNAGAYGNEISDFLTKATVYVIKDKKKAVLNASDLRFSYRYSSLKKGGLILLDCELKIKRKAKENILIEIGKIKERRKSSQPTDAPSLGSVFKRTDLHPASFLIDKAGLKGSRVGDAQISEKHAGFIVNLGNASASDYMTLVDLIKREIFNKYGVVLEEEIEKL